MLPRGSLAAGLLPRSPCILWGRPLDLIHCLCPPATKVVSHLIEKLPGSVGDKAPPADVIVNIIAVLNNLVVESPMAARDIVYFDGLRKLFYVKKRRDRWELTCLFFCPTRHRSHLFFHLGASHHS